MSEPREASLLDELKALNKEITKQRQLIREIPLMVLMPEAEAALQRIRKTTAELAIPQAAVPSAVARLPAGALARTPEGETVRVLAAGVTELSPRAEVRLVLLPDGTTRIMKVEELGEAEAERPTTPPTPVSSQIPPAPGPETSQPASVAPPGLRPGDRVSTPFGEGDVTQIIPGPTPQVEVSIPGKSTFYFNPAELRVLPASTS